MRKRMLFLGNLFLAITAAVGFGVSVIAAFLTVGFGAAVVFEPWSRAGENLLVAVGSLAVSFVGFKTYDLSRLRLRKTGVMDAFPILTDRTLKIAGGMLVAVGLVALFTFTSGLSSAGRAEALEMCVSYQQRVVGVDRTSAEGNCTPLIDTADAHGCDFDTTIRYIAAGLETRPYRIRHEEIFGFPAPVENPSVVLQEC